MSLLTPEYFYLRQKIHLHGNAFGSCSLKMITSQAGRQELISFHSVGRLQHEPARAAGKGAPVGRGRGCGEPPVWAGGPPHPDWSGFWEQHGLSRAHVVQAARGPSAVVPGAHRRASVHLSCRPAACRGNIVSSSSLEKRVREVEELGCPGNRTAGWQPGGVQGWKPYSAQLCSRVS